MFKKYLPDNRLVADNVCRFYWLIVLVFSLLVTAPDVWAHKVMIFAWVEGDTVYTQSKFSGGKRVVNSPVLVFDGEGNRLLEGKTDENGEFFFKVPKKTAMKVVLKASMGHMAEWQITEEEISAADVPGSSSSKIGLEDAAGETTLMPIDNSVEDGHGDRTINLDTEELQKILDASLDKKLAPILNMLVNSRDRSPSLTEVIGGIGYIFGLTGVALYFAHRRKRSTPNK